MSVRIIEPWKLNDSDGAMIIVSNGSLTTPATFSSLFDMVCRGQRLGTGLDYDLHEET